MELIRKFYAKQQAKVLYKNYIIVGMCMFCVAPEDQQFVICTNVLSETNLCFHLHNSEPKIASTERKYSQQMAQLFH